MEGGVPVTIGPEREKGEGHGLEDRQDGDEAGAHLASQTVSQTVRKEGREEWERLLYEGEGRREKDKDVCVCVYVCDLFSGVVFPPLDVPECDTERDNEFLHDGQGNLGNESSRRGSMSVCLCVILT